MAVLAAASVMLYLAPRFFPQAAIRPGAVAFGIGFAILLAGLVVRGRAIRTLGGYFTGSVQVSSDQPVVTTASTGCCVTPATPGSCWPR